MSFTPRVRSEPHDLIELVIKGTDKNGVVCWRTYKLTVADDGSLWKSCQTVAYSPPADWNELSPA